MHCFQRVCARRSKKAHEAFFVYVIKYASSLVSIDTQLLSVGSWWHLTPERPGYSYNLRNESKSNSASCRGSGGCGRSPCACRGCQRRVWVHSINRGRGQYGEYHRLCQELRLDEDRFKVYFRLNRQQFECWHLLGRPSPRWIQIIGRASVPPNGFAFVWGE